MAAPAFLYGMYYSLQDCATGLYSGMHGEVLFKEGDLLI